MKGFSGSPQTLSQSHVWRPALRHALPAALLVLGLLYYWFAVADRYIVFLYNHDMGPLYPDTSPFSRVTASRYWMAALVANGAVLVLYTTAVWIRGRLSPNYRPPAWWAVWSLGGAVIAIGVPAITLTVNQPTLPVAHAARVTLAAVIGLALALGLGQMAAREPAKLLWLAADGLWLFFGPLQFYQVERLGRWLDRGSELYVTLLVTTQVAALGWWTLITLLGWLRRRPVPSAAKVFFSGLGLAYLFMPLVHHTVGTDGYFYITDSDNFLAQSPLVRLAVWLAAAVITIGMTWLRRRLAAVPSPRTLHPLARFSEGLR